MKREKYVSPRAEFIVCEAVQTLNPISGDKEGSAVLISWLVD